MEPDEPAAVPGVELVDARLGVSQRGGVLGETRFAGVREVGHEAEADVVAAVPQRDPFELARQGVDRGDRGELARHDDQGLPLGRDPSRQVHARSRWGGNRNRTSQVATNIDSQVAETVPAAPSASQTQADDVGGPHDIRPHASSTDAPITNRDTLRAALLRAPRANASRADRGPRSPPPGAFSRDRRGSSRRGAGATR